MGLDDFVFGTACSNILNMDPLPNVNQTYSRIIREERHRYIAKSKDKRANAFSFAVRVHIDKHKQWCIICNKNGHEAKEYYQVIGYPEWWGERPRNSVSGRGRGNKGAGVTSVRGRGKRGSGVSINSSIPARTQPVWAHAAQAVERDARAAAAVRPESEENIGIPGLSSDQWSTLMTLLNTQKSSTFEKLSGKRADEFWLINTGASHHMSSRTEFFSNIRDISPCPIGMPDGTHTSASQEGDI